MIEKNDLYDYGLAIYQNKEYFKFSLDSILLGEFIKLKNDISILDLCTGNAPIPLILLTRNSTIKIDAVEIQKEVYELAKKSIKENGFEDRVKLYNVNINSYTTEKKYDVVLANPPYFKNIETSYQNENKIKRIARHEVLLTLEEVVCAAKKHLKENGTFYLVHRTERFLDVISCLSKNKLGIRKITFIYTKHNNSAEFFLLEASKYKKSDIKFFSLNIENRKTYKNIFEE